MRVIFLGTPQFAVPALESIHNSCHELVAVVAQPDKLGDRKKIVFGAVKKWSLMHNLPLYQLAKLSTVDGVQMLASYQPDIIVTAAYGQMLSQEVINVAKYGIINIHGSLLPQLRGASPIQHSIINGETSTGITILQTVLAMDAGDMIAKQAIDILPQETFGSLYQRMAILGGEMIVGILDDIANGTAIFTPQDDNLATFCKKITSDTERIDWNWSAERICCLIRALNPSPLAWTVIEGKRVKLLHAQACQTSSNQCAGTILTCNKNTLVIACGQGALDIRMLQPDSGKAMDITSYLCSRKHAVGSVVGQYE